jgi:hypothetical protein
LPIDALNPTLNGVDTESIRLATLPIVENSERRSLLMLMAEYFSWLGYTDIRARLPGHPAPSMLSGTLEDHRPDLTCRQSDSRQTPLILETVCTSELSDPRLEHRWTLLFSAARLYGAELHFCVPSWSEAGPGDQLLRQRLERLDVRPHRLWSV